MTLLFQIFTVVALQQSVGSLVATTFFKKLYNATVDTFPIAFLVYSASVYVIPLVFNLILFCYRHDLTDEEEQEGSITEQKNDEDNIKELTSIPTELRPLKDKCYLAEDEYEQMDSKIVWGNIWIL